MFTRILTDLERKKIKTFLKDDGEKSVVVRSAASRCRKHLPQIKEDMALLEDFLASYTKSKE